MTPDEAPFPATERTTIGRSPDRGTRDRRVAEAILDEGVLCHVGVTTDHGPVVIPTTYARRGDELLIHGSPAASWLRATGKGTPVCVTVTMVDGLVLARSAFHHSMNYRSVVVFGQAEPITDHGEKAAALDAIVEHIVPGRTAEVRPMRDDEVRGTLVVRLRLDEASTKIRAGGPIDDDDDLDLVDVWAGVIPVRTAFGEPEPDELSEALPTPPSVVDYGR
ncbi:pyridoxamine 5'-phosphate oxidase family protein [Acidimicrobiia bacterium EGI L10123]|uniref:pyridoxamine 5'-phosphate oxidase family protein n=1 Tax=Salinilacustrithrix flava TaxID=2957203 RepID=UPI003D7C33D1|nr:pyridoxamine 5'-phosphate oxidase family protein [Acidimicrobiia bacterium EGI L10123]